jgi:hypothetical protein
MKRPTLELIVFTPHTDNFGALQSTRLRSGQSLSGVYREVCCARGVPDVATCACRAGDGQSLSHSIV